MKKEILLAIAKKIKKLSPAVDKLVLKHEDEFMYNEENDIFCEKDAKKNGLVTVRSLPWRQLPCCWLKESIG